jgi:short-subunit dehydrogenase
LTRKRSIASSCSLVTGASGGIGRAIALELGRLHGGVVLVARRAEELTKVADEIRSIGGRAVCVTGDITDPAVRQAALAQSQRSLGGLDILVNNAGRGARGRFADASPQHLREIFEINFFAPAELIRESMPLLRASRDANRRPIIVNIGSILGHRATPQNSEYCASKFALRGLTESLRPELARIGIDVLLVSPGPTESEFGENVINPTQKIPWPEPKRVTAQQVARAAVRAIQAGKRESVPSLRGRMLLWGNRLAPGLVDRLMRRFG